MKLRPDAQPQLGWEEAQSRCCARGAWPRGPSFVDGRCSAGAEAGPSYATCGECAAHSANGDRRAFPPFRGVLWSVLQHRNRCMRLCHRDECRKWPRLWQWPYRVCHRGTCQTAPSALRSVPPLRHPQPNHVQAALQAQHFVATRSTASTCPSITHQPPHPPSRLVFASPRGQSPPSYPLCPAARYPSRQRAPPVFCRRAVSPMLLLG